jgi:hypothetical protein
VLADWVKAKAHVCDVHLSLLETAGSRRSGR